MSPLLPEWFIQVWATRHMGSWGGIGRSEGQSLQGTLSTERLGN